MIKSRVLFLILTICCTQSSLTRTLGASPITSDVWELKVSYHHGNPQFWRLEKRKDRFIWNGREIVLKFFPEIERFKNPHFLVQGTKLCRAGDWAYKHQSKGIILTGCLDDQSSGGLVKLSKIIDYKLSHKL